jgi:membrane protein YqaA with SNARE-associated domain
MGAEPAQEKKPNLLRRLYAWTKGWAERPSATAALFVIAFVEAFIFPIPPDVLLMALAGSRPRRAFWFALICTAGSVAGGIVGYGIGYLLQGLGEWIMALFASPEVVAGVKEQIQAHAFAGVIIAAFTPIPDKVANIVAGAVPVNFFVFLAAYIVGRGSRFFFVSGLIFFAGPKVQPLVEKHLELVTTLMVVLVIAGFAALKLLAG